MQRANVDVVRTRYGRMIVHSHQLHISEALIAYGEYSEGEVDLFRQMIKPGDLVVDAGANIGAHTVPLARIVGPTGIVLAIEPQRFVFQTLCGNVALNELRNVHTVNVALGSAPGVTEVPVYDVGQPNNSGGGAVGGRASGVTFTPAEVVGLDRVPVATIDAICAGENVAFIKADVEGSECELLRGAVGTIARCRPILYVEDDKDDRREELRQTLRDYKYRIWRHEPLCFNRNNYASVETNILVHPESGAVYASFNLLCLPEETTINVDGLVEV